MIREKSLIKSTKHLAPGIYTLWLYCPRITKHAKPGQFVQIQLSNSYEPFLCRPLSIADTEFNKLRIIFRIRGKGTLLLKDKKPGDELFLLGPLGKPITLSNNKNIILCAGGVGIAPLLFLAKKIPKKNKLQLYFGTKNKSEIILQNEFKPLCEKIFLTTEDGSVGKKGVITDLLNKVTQSDRTTLYAAGPTDMLKNIKVKVSEAYGFLEERMGCGCGICFGCAIKKKSGGNLRVCIDGPVFNLNEIEL
jgi:dihydroorotate dehydrogenase electron transfer subunit